jgi:tetratricopeptide (TPR) repeat protein
MPISRLKFLLKPANALILFACMIALAGCSGLNSQSSQSGRASQSKYEQKIAAPKQNVTHELVKQGIQYLREGNYEDAQQVFSASVKVSPNSSTLHLLNGISYHLQYLNNTPDSKGLAETAYELSASLDKSDTLPLIQLGRLHIDSGEYSIASKNFISAYAISPSSQDALFGLLQSSLWQKDFKTALWAGEGLKKLNTTDADKIRLMVLMYVAVGKTSEANQSFDAYSKVNASNPKEIDQLKQQVAYISNQFNSINSLEFDPASNSAGLVAGKQGSGKMVKVAAGQSRGASGSGGINGVVGGNAVGNNSSSARGSSSANTGNNDSSSTRGSNTRGGAVSGYESNQNSDDSGGDSGSSGSSSGGSSGAGITPYQPPTASSPMTSGGGGGGSYSAVSMNQQQQRWFDCDTKPGLGKAPGGSYGVPVGGTSGDQTLYLEPLPSPCNKQNPPKMASIDAVLIRTLDSENSQYGINLLNGLQVFAGSQSFSTTGSSDGKSVSSVVQNSVIGIGNATSATINSVSGLISYTLNIANSTTSNSQVIARPTLTALDRIPSTFYSGSVITAGLNGGGVSGAQITNIPTGVSLSVTPTFIDEESMMLAVKVSRSFVSSASAVGGFSAGVATDQHAVTANVKIKYGETLILDGLASRQISGGQNGVPVLKDIPIIQYLFSQKIQSLYSENVVVLVTPRKVQTEDELRKSTAKNSGEELLSPKEKSIYRAMRQYQEIVSSSDTNLDNTLSALDRDSSYFRAFKTSALGSNHLDSWVTEPGINKFFDDAANLLYFTR